MDELESFQIFSHFFIGMLRPRLGGQLDGLALVPPWSKWMQLGMWFKDQFKSMELKNQAALSLLHMKETTSQAAPEITRLNLFKGKLTVVECAVILYVLQVSPHKLQELNLGY